MAKRPGPKPNAAMAVKTSSSVPMAKRPGPKPVAINVPHELGIQFQGPMRICQASCFDDPLPAFCRSFRISAGVTSLPDRGSWNSKAARPLLLDRQILRKRTGITRKEYPDYTINPQTKGGHAMSQFTVPRWHRSFNWGYGLVFRSRILHALRFHAAARVRWLHWQYPNVV